MNADAAIDDGTEILALTPAQRAWRRWRPWLEKAIADNPSFNGIRELEADIEAGRSVFWSDQDGALITRFDNYPEGRALVVVCAANNPSKEAADCWACWLPQLAAYARDYECQFLTVEGQEGDAALMRALGLLPAFTTWITDLSGAAEDPSAPAPIPSGPAATERPPANNGAH